ncbi:MAG: maleylpyruvate isomerase N-terminal domain-containing protein [Acidimicrobiales bacterium]
MKVKGQMGQYAGARRKIPISLLNTGTDVDYTAGLADLPLGLDALRRRLLDLVVDLNTDEWRHPSRCPLWAVQDVVGTHAASTSVTFDVTRHSTSPSRSTPRRLRCVG